MPTRMNWERANRVEQFKKTQPGSTDMMREYRKAQQYGVMAAFVTKHNLACFRCGSKRNRWAKTGISRRGPWAICLSCVKRDE